jgi:hypothetical protein
VNLALGVVNRRAYFRQPMYASIEIRIPGQRAAVPATLVDVSGGGCRLTTRVMLKPRATVTFDLPVEGARPIKLSGRVTKVRYTPADRTFHYGVQFQIEREEQRDRLLHFIGDEQRRALEAARLRRAMRGEEQPTQERRSTTRVRMNFALQYSISGVPGAFAATALDIGVGGARLALDQVLRTEWAIELRLTLPNDVLRMAAQVAGSNSRAMRPFHELRIAAQPQTGVLRTQEHFIQRLTFVHAPRLTTSELTRFVAAAQAISK